MKKTTLYLALSAFLPTAAPISAIAADSNSSENEPFEIVITAKGQQSLADVAATSHIISTEDIEQSQATDIIQLLEQNSGINIARNGGRGANSSTFIRGASSGQIIVLVDGVRINSATLGSTDIGHIPLDFIEKIEVVKGPLSGLYGADAIGGVIQIFTKKGAESSSLSLEAGSFGHKKAAAALNSKNFRFSVKTEETDGIDAHINNDNGNDDEDGFKETAINIGSNFELSDSSELVISGFFAENEIEFDNPFATSPAEYKTENEINTLTANLSNKFSSVTQLSSTLGYSQNNSSTPAYGSQADTDRLSFSSQGEFNLTADQLLILGADLYDESVTSDQNFATTDRDNLGVFTQFQSQINNFGSVLNLRYDDNSTYGSETNGSLALNYFLSESTRITASYGTAFRAPTFNELYFPGFGNADLQPEESESFELSLRGNINSETRASQWRISAYNTQIENLIGYSPEFTAINIDSAKITGVELELGTQVANWLLNGSINLLDATDETTGEQLARRPKQSLQLSIYRNVGKLNIGADILAERGRYDAGEELNGFERVDLKAAYNFSEHFELSAKIGNAFDEEYQLVKDYNTEGRSFLLNGKYKF